MWLELLTISSLGLNSTPLVTSHEADKAVNPSQVAAVERIDANKVPDTEVPDIATLEKNKAIIGEIRFVVKDIFDTEKAEESGMLYRLVNKLHNNTNESTVEEFLLFAPGHTFTHLSIKESERLLRSQRFIYDALIRPIRYHDNIVDLEVITTDVWTLGLSLSYSREGGENKTNYEIRDSNILGTGKELRVKRSNDVDRTENSIFYRDPNLGSKHGELSLGYSDNSDGLSKEINFQRPFISLASRWSYGATYTLNEETSKIYQDSVVSQQFQHNSELYEIDLGYSKGIINDHTKRWTLGFTVDSNLFSANNQTNNSTTLPTDRKLVFPWLRFDLIENNYIKTRRLNFINRTEDLNLGDEYSIKIGWSDRSWNALTNTLLLSTNYQASYKPRDNHLYLSEASFSGRLTEGKSENLRLSSSTKYYYPIYENQIFHYALDIDIGRNLDGENQILIGGETGLRGYPLRIQEGDQSFIFTLEHRFYTDWHIFQLIYLGGALFFDMGRAWSSDTPSTPNSGLLKDVGFGLRLSSSRAAKGKVLHMNFAFPLDGDDSIDDYQFSVGSEATF